MSEKAVLRHWSAKVVVAALALVALTVMAAGCSSSAASTNAGGQSSSTAPATPAKPAVTDPPAAKPQYTKWIVYVNDDASTSQGGMKYAVALNLKATNPSGEPVGQVHRLGDRQDEHERECGRRAP